MLRGQINIHLPPGHPIIAIRNNRNQNGRRIGKKVYYPFWGGLVFSFPADQCPNKFPSQFEVAART